MLIESLLAYAHLAAILSMVVFITSQAALCRSEWLNEAALERLVTVERVYRGALLAVLLTGLARTVWGLKGMGWYWHQPMLHAKVTLWLVMAVMAVPPMRAFGRWQQARAAGQGLPAPAEVQRVRRTVMRAAHLMLLVPLAGVLLARGIGIRG